MADSSVTSSTSLNLGPSAKDEPGGLSPQTLRLIQGDEIRLLRSQMLSRGVLTLLAGIAWIVAELKAPAAFSFLLGYWAVIRLFKFATTARRWWVVSRRDPVAAAAQAARDRALLQAQAARLSARGAYATNLIGAVLLAIALLQFLAVGAGPTAILAAGLDKTRVTAGEWWRLLTASFLHGSLVHLSANLSALIVFGRMVEANVTRSRLVLAYVTAIVAGNLASTWLLPHTPSIGASGGILGLVGFVYALSRRRPSDVPESYGRAAVATMALTGLVGFVGFRFVDNAAHAGGALAGFLVGWLTVPAELPQTERSASRYDDDRVVSMMGALAGILLVAAAVTTGARLFAERSTPVRSLRAQVASRGDYAYDVVLENLKDTRLEAYKLDVYESGSRKFSQWRDERGFEGWHRHEGDGAIAPHERRVVPLGDTRERMTHPSVRLVAAAFSDGTFEGSVAEHEVMDERRASTAADADYWIGVIDEALAVPLDQVANLLDERIGERAKVNAAAHRSSFIAIGSLLGTATHKPERLAAEAQAERARLVTLRDELRASIR